MVVVQVVVVPMLGVHDVVVVVGVVPLPCQAHDTGAPAFNLMLPFHGPVGHGSLLMVRVHRAWGWK